MRAREVVVCPVGKEIEGSRARREEGTPPPPVVLGAEVQVAHDHGALSARDDEDGEDKEEEAEHVVEAVLPDGREDEEELYEHGPEGQQSTHNGRDAGVHEPLLGGDLAGDGVDARGHRDGLGAEAHVGAGEGEGDGDEEGEEDDRNEGAKGNSTRRPVGPDERVEPKEDNRAHALEREGRQQRDLELALLLEDGAEPRSHIARSSPREEEEEEEGVDERPAVRGREEAQARAREREHGHHQQLHTRAGVDSEEAGGGGGAEDVAIHELPARLLTELLLLDRTLLVAEHLVVPVEVVLEHTCEDHSDDGGEEDEDDERVGDREPVDLVILDLVHLQVHVPAGGPLDVAKLPLHVVGPDDLLALSRVDDEGIVLQKLPAGGLLARGKARVGDRALVPLPPVRVLDRVRVHVEANNVVAISVPAVLAVHGVVQNLEAKVVVKDILVILLVRLLLGALLELAAEAVT
mmetsp:Transcript_33195/g.81504  ORF Transcript_33195/g.81504 Transcript_33195/m.81504 type:complete len:464 (-) Transcript_33195:489-1880(-)